LRRNYAALVLDGGLYVAGAACVAAETVFPTVLSLLGAPPWLVALGPSLTLVGFFALPLFTAHWVDKLVSYKRFVAWMSVPQRLAPMAAGLALVFFGAEHPAAVLGVVVAAPLVLGVFGGAHVAGFWELVAKVLPPERRASNLAVRNILGSVLGLAAGGLIVAVLTRWPGLPGFGVLYLCMSGCMLLSLVAVCWIRELPNEPVRRSLPEGWRQRARLLPVWLREDVRLRHLVVARACANGVGVMTPFLAIHALGVLERPTSFLGSLVAAQMAGGIAGNLLGGWLGDRHGGRLLARLGGTAMIVLGAGALLNTAEVGFLVMFALLGFGNVLSQNGAIVLQMELFAAERRSTVFAFVSASNFLAMLGCAGLAALLHQPGGAIWPAAAAAVVLLVASQWYYRKLPEPRTLSLTEADGVNHRLHR